MSPATTTTGGESDVDLIAEIGLTAYRLSLSWSRLQPCGPWRRSTREGVAFYRRLLVALRERGVRPFVTLYHWDLPQPLEDAGGWPVQGHGGGSPTTRTSRWPHSATSPTTGSR